MAIQELAQTFNPVTGVFGTGNVQVFSTSGTWSVPPGIGKVRARLWGAGAGNHGSGGGFSLRTIYDLTGVTAIPVSVGAGVTNGTGGTSSFGSYCSATGGVSSAGAVGAGTGGDINYSGGVGNATGLGGGGVASLFGNGGNGAPAVDTNGGNGASGGGAPSPSGVAATHGGNGFFGTGGYRTTTPNEINATTGLAPIFSIDFIGTGGGGINTQPGVNGGGGGGSNGGGGFPGGGGGNGSGAGASGMVIVEW